MSELLALSNIRAGYGDSTVLQDLSITVNEGELVCLIGANGAGKSTTTRVLTGLLQPWQGEVRFEGASIDSIAAHDRVNLGISLAPEGRRVFPKLSVEENLLLGSYSPRARSTRQSTLSEMYDLFPKLSLRRHQQAGSMSGGEQQMLAIARALMARPKLLVLDEPSLGLAPKIIIDVYQAIVQTAKQGVSILFVEQNVHAALSIAHRGYVLANGRITLAGSATELRESKTVQESFLAPRRKRDEGPSLTVDGKAQTSHEVST